MSTPDQTDPDKIPTQPAMAAVRAPPSIEERVAALESAVKALQDTRPELMTALRAEIAAVKSELSRGLADEATKREALEAHIAKVESEVAALRAETAEQTATLTRIEILLKPFGSVLANPRVQNALVALVLAAILAATAWLTSKGHVPQ